MPSNSLQSKSDFFKSVNFRYILAFIIALAIAFGLPPENGLTPSGVRALAVIVATLFLWMTVNTHWSCILLFLALIMTEVMTPAAVWENSLGHFAPFLLLVFTLLSYCLSETGAIDNVAAWFIKRPFVKGKPYAFLAVFLFSNILIGLFMQNIAMAIIYMDLAAKVCDKIGVKKGESLYTAIALGVLWGNCILSVSSPIAKALPNVLIGLAYTQLGITITYAQWFAVGIPFAIVMFGVMMLCLRIMNPDVTPLKNLDTEEFSKQTPPLSGRGKVALIAMAFMILLILLPDVFLIMGIFVPLAEYFIRIGFTAPAIIAVVALCLIRVKGQVVLDYEQAAKNIPMPVIIFIAAVVLMGVPISDEANGIVVWLGNIFGPLVEGMTPFGIMTVLLVGTLLITNFMSSAVTMVLFFNIGVAMLAGTTANMAAFALALGLVSNISFLTPAAALQTPIFYGPKHITMANTVKINLLFLLLSFIVAMAFIPLISIVVPM